MSVQIPQVPNWVYPGEVHADPGPAEAIIVTFNDLVTPAQAKRAATVAALVLRSSGVRDARVAGPVAVSGRHVVLELTADIDFDECLDLHFRMKSGYQSGMGSSLLEGPPPGGEIRMVYRGW